MCKHRPTEVVTWKVVFPSGREVKGTGVGETRPMVCQCRLVIAAPFAFIRSPCPERSENPRGWTVGVRIVIGNLPALRNRIVMIANVLASGHTEASTSLAASMMATTNYLYMGTKYRRIAVSPIMF